MPFPRLDDLLDIDPPFYVRKLYRRSNWGHADDPIAERVANAVRHAFEADGVTYSLYRIETDADLGRVAIGLNGNRDSLRENIDLVAFLPNELDSCGIEYGQVAGETRCLHANRLHIDMTATRQQLADLCERAMTGGRKAVRLTKSIMRAVVDQASADSCYVVVPDGDGCACEQ